MSSARERALPRASKSRGSTYLPVCNEALFSISKEPASSVPPICSTRACSTYIDSVSRLTDMLLFDQPTRTLHQFTVRHEVPRPSPLPRARHIVIPCSRRSPFAERGPGIRGSTAPAPAPARSSARHHGSYRSLSLFPWQRQQPVWRPA